MDDELEIVEEDMEQMVMQERDKGQQVDLTRPRTPEPTGKTWKGKVMKVGLIKVWENWIYGRLNNQ